MVNKCVAIQYNKIIVRVSYNFLSLLYL